MADPGDVVTVDFVGATGTKRRPAVVVSSALYHQHRPELVLGVLTSQVSRQPPHWIMCLPTGPVQACVNPRRFGCTLEWPLRQQYG